jgi:hypothetical protein
MAKEADGKQRPVSVSMEPAMRDGEVSCEPDIASTAGVIEMVIIPQPISNGALAPKIEGQFGNANVNSLS